MKTEDRQALTGGCQCGAVRFCFSAEPARRSVCHCRMCQKALGNVFARFAGGPLSQFAWTRGAPKIFRSSQACERGFCGECGTPLTWRDTREASIFVTIGSFDDPGRLAPTLNLGLQSKVVWVDSLGTLPASSTKPDPARASRQHPDREPPVSPLT